MKNEKEPSASESTAKEQAEAVIGFGIILLMILAGLIGYVLIWEQVLAYAHTIIPTMLFT